MQIYNTNGIPSTVPGANPFYVIELGNGDIALSISDYTCQIENACNELRDILAIKIFGDLKKYHNYFTAPIFPFAAQAGIDAEMKLSKEDLESLIMGLKSEHKEEAHKLFYYFDVENLIGTLQNAFMETKVIVTQFYRTLNVNSFLIHDNLFMVDQGIQFASGPIVTNVTALINHLFINLYSQLDFTTKIIFELENLHTDFLGYPKLKSKEKLFGDGKHTSFREMQGSIYQLTDNIRTIMYLRNEIVHNSSIDSIPKVYQSVEKGHITEKFILLPDMKDGIIKSFKNRKRFFDDEVKLNELLPELLEEFWQKLLFTLVAIK